MKRNLSISTFSLPALLLLLSTSCTKDVRNEAAQDKLVSTSMSASVTQGDNSAVSGAGAKMHKTDLLKSVKQATSRFHSTTQAIKAGYQPDDHCVSIPGVGGMGYHWVNQSLMDPVFDPLKPEAILYATGPGGNLRLVGLEYIVINTGQTPPRFGDQSFDVGGVPPLTQQNIPHWSLHVWLYEDNPSGMFKPFNPNISCP